MEPYNLKLGFTLMDCPKEWQNFIKKLEPKGHRYNLVEALELYQGKLMFCIRNGVEDIDYVQFPDEANYLMFKLAWYY